MRQHRPVVIYTAAVYGAFKKDRGADIKTGLFMEQGDARAAVWIHTTECVSGSKGGGGRGRGVVLIY